MLYEETFYSRFTHNTSCNSKKLFSKFDRRHFECNTELRSLLQQGLSKPEFYGNLVNKLKKKYKENRFFDQFKTIMRYKRIGYNVDMM